MYCVKDMWIGILWLVLRTNLINQRSITRFWVLSAQIIPDDVKLNLRDFKRWALYPAEVRCTQRHCRQRISMHLSAKPRRFSLGPRLPHT